MAKTILVLEEYGPSRVALCDCIEDLGYTAMPAHTTDEARAIESNASIDLAILDIDEQSHRVLVDDPTGDDAAQAGDVRGARGRNCACRHGNLIAQRIRAHRVRAPVVGARAGELRSLRKRRRVCGVPCGVPSGVEHARPSRGRATTAATVVAGHRRRANHAGGSWFFRRSRVMPQLSPDPAPTAWPDREPALQRVAGHGARVLVVEDEHLVALDIRLRLTRMGFAPEVAFTGADAVQKATEELYDLILMDVRLRGPMDGIDAARTIRGNRDIPVIYLTAYADEATVERARLTEPYGYLLKPFHDRELEATIQIALQRHASERLRSERQQLQRFLSDASAIMAESLDYQRVATGIADVLVPRYADWCLIHLAETSDRVPAYTYARPEPSAPHNLGGDARVVHDVERQHTPRLSSDLDDSDRAAVTFGGGYLPALRGIGARSALCVPLVTRDVVLGSLSLVAGNKRPRYGINDLAFVEDVAHRLAMALDNALLYRRAEQAIRIRDDVLAIVSHDLRGPLATIMLRAEAIARDSTVGHVGAAIMRSAHRMNRLIGDLLDASAINAGKLTLELGEHDASEIIHEACDMFRMQAEQREVVLVEQLPAPGTHVRCDRDRVLQVFANLLSNAIKFTQAGGTVTVVGSPSGAGLALCVRDTGIGIAEDQLPRLFDRFWQAQGRRDGAGLGLYIASGIVDAHGSALTVESVHGQGSTFTFALPLAAT